MIGIISVTEKGDILADKIQASFGGAIYKKSEMLEFSLEEVTLRCFERCKSIVFISSTGIAVRAISKFLKSKDKDPAVIVVDVCNKFSISLLSGHLGGANKLTVMISELLNNIPVITTATDNLEIDAPDIVALKNSLVIEDLKRAKVLASKLVNGKKVYFKDDKSLISCPKGYIQTNKLMEDTLWVTNKAKSEEGVLKLIRKDLVLGIGCRRNTDSHNLYDFVKETMKSNNLSLDSVKLIVSINMKSDEVAILNLSEMLVAERRFYEKDEIAKVEEKYEGSDFVEKAVGVKAVCEPCIELAGGRIIVKKVKKNGMTLAIGELI